MELLFNFPLCVATAVVILICGISINILSNRLAKLLYIIGIMVLIIGIIIVINTQLNQLIVELNGLMEVK